MSIQLDENLGHSLEYFLESWTDTRQWCAELGPHLTTGPQLLRTLQLRPKPLAGSRKHVVASVVSRRKHSLRELRSPRVSNPGGRLLLYYPDANLADGAAQVETYGFFDVDNVPPWDTWVAYIYEDPTVNYLVSWIPELFVGLADGGIQANPEQCIAWLTENNSILERALKERRPRNE